MIINSMALFSGFTLVLSAALLAEQQMAVRRNGSTDGPGPLPAASVAGRIAYLSAPVAVADTGIGGDGFAHVSSGDSSPWQVVFAGTRSETDAGSPAALLEAVRMQRPIAVRVPTFHGYVFAQCLDAYETTQNEVGCEVEFWCDGPSQVMIPARHKHIAVIRSSGEVQQAVAVHNERDEERIVQVGYTADPLTWYAE